MRIIRDRRICESQWRHLPEGTLPDALVAAPAGPVSVALTDWRLFKTELLERDAPIGVRLTGADVVDEIVADLKRIALVALEFGSVTEGRAYTQARALREKHGYFGEVRAVGDVSRDRLAFMERCGFNAFELRPDCDLHDALQAFGEISLAYQALGDGQPAIAALRA